MSKSTKSMHRDNRIGLRPRSHCHSRLSLYTERTLGCFLLGFWLAVNANVHANANGRGRCLWGVSIPKGVSAEASANPSYSKSRWRNKEFLTNDDFDHDDDKSESVQTQRQLLLLGRSFMDEKMPKDHRITSRRNRNKNENINDCSLVSDNAFKNDFRSEEDCRIDVVRNVNRKIPTPWPINIIQERLSNRPDSSSQIAAENKDDTVALNDHGTKRSSSYPSMGAIFFAYAKQQARIGFRQFSEISAQLWYNLPPSAPPLILLASIPRNIKVLEASKNAAGAAASDSVRRIIPLFSDPFARSIVLAGMGMAVVSWSNQELQRKRKLTPLPLRAMSNDYQGVKGGGRVSRVFLPPFLPEDVPEPEIDALLGTAVETSKLGSNADNDDELAANAFEETVLSHVSPKIRRHLTGIYETTTTTSKRFFRNYYHDWVQGRAVRKREVAKIRRNRIFDELVALQALKKRQAASRKKSETNTSASVDSAAPELGYALITGASRGIGRAIAVELARWEIPMVLVARDVARLAGLASELEACYGVKCCILEADLSKANAAEKIHQATTEAGITVDILINNAGVASEGLAIDSKTPFVESMIMLNSVTYAKLSVLYGRDMKRRRRGRILMMSSMAGLCNASPNTALYGACKAFGKSLALSMAKEMETYGVGVTCLIPGAVSDTDFRASSGTGRALCWYLPFYSRPPEIVAHQGVVSLLDGDTQSIPGWQNRAFANIVRPIIPQRLEIILIQLAFSPLRIPSLKSLFRNGKVNINGEENPTTDDATPNSLPSDEGSSWLSFKPRYTTQPPPRFLKLQEDEPKELETKSEELNSEELVNEELSSPSPITSNDVNSTKAGILREVIEPDENTIYQPDSTLNILNSSEQTENKGIIHEIEPEMIEGQSESSVIRRQEQYSNKNERNSDDNNHAKQRELARKDGVKRTRLLSEERNIPKKQEGDGYGKRYKQRIASKHNNEKITEGNRIERVQRPQWFVHEDDDDDTFSTRLGPITIKDQREMMLPKQTDGNRRETQTVAV